MRFKTGKRPSPAIGLAGPASVQASAIAPSGIVSGITSTPVWWSSMPSGLNLRKSTLFLRFHLPDDSSSITCSWRAPAPGGPVVGGGADSVIPIFIGRDAGGIESARPWPAPRRRPG